MSEDRSILVRFASREEFEHIMAVSGVPMMVDWGQPDEDGAYTPGMFKGPSDGTLAWAAGIALLLAGVACFLIGRLTA